MRLNHAERDGTISALHVKASLGPCPSTPFETKAGELDDALSSLRNAVSNLLNRIAIVLQPEATEGQSSDKDTSPPRSELVRFLETSTTKIYFEVQRLDAASGRLDI